MNASEIVKQLREQANDGNSVAGEAATLIESMADVLRLLDAIAAKLQTEDDDTGHASVVTQGDSS